jgi:hypothetical protein
MVDRKYPAVVPLYTRFLQCFVSTAEDSEARASGIDLVPKIIARPRKMQDARWLFMQDARKQKSNIKITDCF